MSLLSVFLIAPEGDAQRISALDDPARHYPAFEATSIENVKVATLHEILTGRSFEELLPLYDPVGEGSEEGPGFSFSRANW